MGTELIRKSIFEGSPHSFVELRFRRLRKKFTFPLTKIYYGPYVCNGILKHRPEKLRGLIAGVKNLCISIELIPVSKINYLEVNTWGYVIFQANIIYFKFNNEDDPHLRASLRKIEEALIRMLDDNNTTGYDYEPPAQDLSTQYDSDSISEIVSNKIQNENIPKVDIIENLESNIQIENIPKENMIENVESNIQVIPKEDICEKVESNGDGGNDNIPEVGITENSEVTGHIKVNFLC